MNEKWKLLNVDSPAECESSFSENYERGRRRARWKSWKFLLTLLLLPWPAVDRTNLLSLIQVFQIFAKTTWKNIKNSFRALSFLARGVISVKYCCCLVLFLREQLKKIVENMLWKSWRWWTQFMNVEWMPFGVGLATNFASLCVDCSVLGNNPHNLIVAFAIGWRGWSVARHRNRHNKCEFSDLKTYTKKSLLNLFTSGWRCWKED